MCISRKYILLYTTKNIEKFLKYCFLQKLTYPCKFLGICFEKLYTGRGGWLSPLLARMQREDSTNWRIGVATLFIWRNVLRSGWVDFESIVVVSSFYLINKNKSTTYSYFVNPTVLIFRLVKKIFVFIVKKVFKNI